MESFAAAVAEDTLRLNVFPLLSGIDVAAGSVVSHLWCSAQLSPELWQELCAAAGGLDVFAATEHVGSPKDAYRAYVEAMRRWTSGQPSSLFIAGESLLQQGIGDHGLGPKDATTMICGLCLEGFWLVLAFNGGVVQFWQLPAALCRSTFELPTSVNEIDFDLKGRRLCVILANLSVAIYDCGLALAESGPVSLPLLRCYDDFQSAPKHIAFWGPGLAVATSRRIMVLGPEMDLIYCVHDASFWDMGKSFLIVKNQSAQIDICRWEEGSLEVKSQQSAGFCELELLCGIEGKEGCLPQLLCQREGRLSFICFDNLRCWTSDSWTELNGIRQLGHTVVPVASLDGSVKIVQAALGTVFCDESPLCEANMVATDIRTPLASEVCSPDVHSPSSSFITYVDARIGHFSLMLLHVPGPSQPMHLAALDLGSEEDDFFEDGDVLTASNRRFLVVSDRSGIHAFDFGNAPKPTLPC